MDELFDRKQIAVLLEAIKDDYRKVYRNLKVTHETAAEVLKVM
jgi:hypothetical protein